MPHEWKVDAARNADYLFDPKQIVVNADLNGRDKMLKILDGTMAAEVAQ